MLVGDVLVEDDRCVFVEAHGVRTLVIWEEGMGFVDRSLLDAGSEPIVRVGEMFHGGGGSTGDRSHIEDLVGEPIPERCIPEGGGDRFAIAFDVEGGPFG